MMDNAGFQFIPHCIFLADVMANFAGSTSDLCPITSTGKHMQDWLEQGGLPESGYDRVALCAAALICIEYFVTLRTAAERFESEVARATYLWRHHSPSQRRNSELRAGYRHLQRGILNGIERMADPETNRMLLCWLAECRAILEEVRRFYE